MQNQNHVKPEQYPRAQNTEKYIQSESTAEDIMVRDNNPYFQDKVEGKVLGHLQKKSKEKLINWSIYNSGKQTIIVL